MGAGKTQMDIFCAETLPFLAENNVYEDIAAPLPYFSLTLLLLVGEV